MKSLKYLYILALSLPIIFSSCSDNGGTAKVQVALIDAPADYDAVNIDIQDVQVNVGSDEESDESGWQSLDSAEPGIYDLLLLTNGEEQFLGEIELQEGNLGQVRLILGSNNTLTVDGEDTPLTVPSGSQSGLKLNIDAEIQAGITYKLVIDFDAAKSVVKSGNSGKYNLKPVIRAEMEATTGAISGNITPADTEAVIYAIAGEDSVSTYPDEDGAFLVRALMKGTYSLSAVPSEGSGFTTVEIENIEVVNGETAEAGTIDFTK